MDEVGEAGELRDDDLASVARRLNQDFEVAWGDANFDHLASLHASDLRVESHRAIGQLSYVGMEEFRRQTWGLRDLFPSASLKLIEVAAPAHFMSRVVFADGGGNEIVILMVQQVADGLISSVSTFDEDRGAEARAHMLRVATGGANL